VKPDGPVDAFLAGCSDVGVFGGLHRIGYRPARFLLPHPATRDLPSRTVRPGKPMAACGLWLDDQAREHHAE